MVLKNKLLIKDFLCKIDSLRACKSFLRSQLAFIKTRSESCMIFLHTPSTSQDIKKIYDEDSKLQGDKTSDFQDKGAQCLMQELYHLLERGRKIGCSNIDYSLCHFFHPSLSITTFPLKASKFLNPNDLVHIIWETYTQLRKGITLTPSLLLVSLQWAYTPLFLCFTLFTLYLLFYPNNKQIITETKQDRKGGMISVCERDGVSQDEYAESGLKSPSCPSDCDYIRNQQTPHGWLQLVQ